MIKTIKLKGLTGRFTAPSFLWTENEPLTIKFDINEHRVGRYVCVVNCGEQKKTVYLGKDLSVDISPDFIKDGGFNPIYVLLEFRNAYGDKVIIPNNPARGGFFIEPLYVERVTENTTFQAWASKLEAQLEALHNRFVELSEKVKNFEDEGVPLLAEEENENEIEGEYYYED